MRRFQEFLNKRNSGSANVSQQPFRQDTSTAQHYVADEQAQAVAAGTPIVEATQHKAQSRLGFQATPGILNIALRNDTTSSTVYAYISGRAIDRGNALFLLQADGRSPYYPTSPSSILQPLQANCAIALGVPGNTVYVQIPRIAGGRIWFSVDSPLTFFLNPGPALVEPSITNPSDPNINTDFTFAEFTYNADQLYANISYVDSVSIPVSLTLQTINGGTQTVAGLLPTGLQQIANALRAQDVSDGTPNSRWSRLIVNIPGTNTPLRILSPNQANILFPGLFTNYYAPYVSSVFQKLCAQPITLDTQASYGILTSVPSPNNTLTIGTQQFSAPTTEDIFSCSTGPFATGSDPERNTIIPRLAAAFNRSTFLQTDAVPATQDLYYREHITNHYSRIVHAANGDGRGYAFPYDDVQATGQPDQSGAVYAGDPEVLIVAVGGGWTG